ncbi:MAG TPA: hypothetical protein VEL11_13645, partial [Candidatus Bathyarchaeia archaeon]|nr:hypothetical protein [Candidatus Bathyarchaeia archaeon]
MKTYKNHNAFFNRLRNYDDMLVLPFLSLATCSEVEINLRLTGLTCCQNIFSNRTLEGEKHS